MNYKEAYEILGSGEGDTKEASHVVVSTLLNTERIEKKCGMGKSCKDVCKECLFNILNDNEGTKKTITNEM